MIKQMTITAITTIAITITTAITIVISTRSKPHHQGRLRRAFGDIAVVISADTVMIL